MKQSALKQNIILIAGENFRLKPHFIGSILIEKGEE